MLPAAFLPAIQTPMLLVPFPGFEARRVAPAFDNSAGGGVIVSCCCLVWGQCWLCLYLDMADSNNGNDNNGDDDAYGTKNGVNVPFQRQSPPSI
eukprot:92111-Ditylum_brightwellii.AAC.1